MVMPPVVPSATTADIDGRATVIAPAVVGAGTGVNPMAGVPDVIGPMAGDPIAVATITRTVIISGATIIGRSAKAEAHADMNACFRLTG